MHNLRTSIWHSVVPTSRSSYQTGWKYWTTFVEDEGSNPFLTLIPADWNAGVPVPFSFFEYMVIRFLSMLCLDKQLKARTSFSYLAAVKFMLTSSLIDTAIIDTSQFIRKQRSGLSHISRITSAKSEAETKRFPITLDVIVHMATRVFPPFRSPKQQAILVASLLAFICLMRRSEYLPTPANHYLRAQDVSFIIIDVRSNIHNEIQVPSHDVHLYELDSVREIVINIRSAKNDIGGEGHRFVFPRQIQSSSSSHAFDVVKECWDWANLARPVKDNPFLSFSTAWALTPTLVQDALRDAAKTLDLDPSRITLHGLRIGGASALAAAGFPDHYIQKLGRWKSLVFLEYIRLSQQACSKALSHLMDPSSLSVLDLTRIHSSM